MPPASQMSITPYCCCIRTHSLHSSKVTQLQLCTRRGGCPFPGQVPNPGHLGNPSWCQSLFLNFDWKSFPTEWLVVQSFVSMRQKGNICAQEENFTKVQKAFVLIFVECQRACSEATSRSYYPGLGTHKSVNF